MLSPIYRHAILATIGAFLPSSTSVAGGGLQSLSPGRKLPPMFSPGTSPAMTFGRKSKRVSAASQKRASTKARNRARNKAHH